MHGVAARARPLNGQAPFERSLGALHAAALDDGLWPGASAAVHACCGSRGNFVIVGGAAAPDEVDVLDVLFTRFCLDGERRPDFEQLYLGKYHAIDESVPCIRRLPDSKVVHVSSLYTGRERKRSAMFNEALPLSHTSDSLVVRLDGPRGSRVVWVIADPLGREGWSGSRRRAVEGLLPLLRHYARVRQALFDAQALASTAVGLLENRGLGVVQLDRRGRVVDGNDRAQALLRAHDGIRDARLGALVLLEDPAARQGIDPDRVARMLDLTPAEGRIAVMLGQGLGIDAAAAAGCSRTTVKWHIKNMYAKHGLSRQVELAQLVCSIPGEGGPRASG